MFEVERDGNGSIMEHVARKKKFKKRRGKYAGPLMRLTVKYSCN